LLLTTATAAADAKATMSEARANGKRKNETRQSLPVRPSDAETVSSIDALVCLDPQAHIIAWNLAAQRLFGFGAEEAIGKSLVELLCPPQLRPAAIAMLESVSSREGPVYFDTQQRKKDGSPIDVSVCIIAARGGAGKPVNIWVTYRDISEQKRAEAELEDRLDREEAVAALGQRALAASELTPVLDAAVALTADTLGVDSGNVLELQPDGKALLLRAGVGWKPGIVGHATVSSGSASQAGYTLLSKEPIIVEDLRTETRFHGSQLLIEHEVVSGLSVMIGDSGRPYGVLGVHTRSRRKFTANDANFLQAVANIIALTVKRLASEHELRRSEGYFRSLIDNSFDVVVVLDQRGTICFENAAMRHLLGYEPGELPGQIGFDFVDPADVENARASLAEALDRGSSKLECRVRRKDGAWLSCEMALSRVLDLEGRQAAVVNIRDISERLKRTAAESHLAAIVQSADAAIVSVSADFQVQSWNPGAERLFGYTAAEAIGRRPDELLVRATDRGVDADQFARDVADLGEPFASRSFEAPLQRKDGTQFEAALITSGIYDAQRQLIGVSMILRDISEQRHKHAELQSLGAIVASTDDGVSSVDTNLRITCWNRGAEKLFDIGARQAIGQPALLLLPTAIRGQTERMMREDLVRAAESRDFARRIEFDLPGKNDTVRQISVSMSGIYDERGEIVGLSQIFRDVTELKRGQQAAAFLASIVDSSPTAIFGTTQDGKIASWNRAAASLYGYSAREIVGQPFEVLVPEGETGAGECLEQAMRGELRGLRETRRRHKDGQVMMVSVSHAPILDQRGAVVGMASLERNRSEETRLEQELQQAQAHIRDLIESSLDAMLTVGSDLIITDVNQQTVKLLGTSRDAVVGSRFDRYFTDPQRAAQGIGRALSDGVVADFDLAIKSDGKEVPVSLNASVVHSRDGKRGGVFAVAREVTHYKELEKQLRQAQAYTRSLIESSLDGMLTVDNNLVINDVNERMATLAETPRTMLIGSRFARLFTDPERAEDGVRQALSEGSITDFDLTLRTMNGREILVSFNASIFHDVGGRPQGVFGVAHDVTALRRLDQQLREQQIYSRSLIECSIDAQLAVSPGLNITDVNEQAVRLTGYSRAELIGSSFPILFSDPAHAAEGVHKALAEGFVKDYELTLRAANGSELPLSFNASPFKNPRGKVLGILAAARDVGERQRLERERSLLASIVTTSPDAIYSYAPDTTITSWNAGAQRCFGYGAAEMLGHSMTVCVPLERRRELLERLKLVLSGTGVQQFETRGRRKDGELLDVSVTMSAITDKEGNVTAIAAIYRDIAERKRFELELTKARDEALETSRVHSHFLGNMSHEIRIPLNSITGMADILLESSLADEQRRQLLSIKTSTDCLLAILNDILYFSKLSTGKTSFETVDLDLEEVFHKALNSFATTPGARAWRLSFRLSPTCRNCCAATPIGCAKCSPI
jgi:PAS domain S-box-containing protein